MSIFDRGKSRTRRRLAAAFGGGPVNWEKAARDYRELLLHALGAGDGADARGVFDAYDGRFPAARHVLAFSVRDEPVLAGLVVGADADALEVLLALGHRAGIAKVAAAARDALVDAQAARGDADRLVALLLRLHASGLLDAPTMARGMLGHLARRPLGADAPLWTAFLAGVPDGWYPDVFAVHALLGRGARAVALAATAEERREALAACLRSASLADVRAGLALATPDDEPVRTGLRKHAGDLLFAEGSHAEALSQYAEAGDDDGVSRCHERLGDALAALETCPRGFPERLDRLTASCWRAVDALVAAADHLAAAALAGRVLARLRAEPDDAAEAAGDAAAADAARVAEAVSRHAAVAAVGRRRIGHGDHHARSLFEEALGELFAAASHAERDGDVYRAHGLYLRAGRPGDAERVLREEPGGRRERAAAREAGGDLAGAAALYEEEGERERAVDLYLRADRPAEAARCLEAGKGVAAIEDPRLVECLRRAGDHERLTALALHAVDTGAHTERALELLREARDRSEIPPHLEEAVARVLQASHDREAALVEEHVEAWLRRARAEIDGRYAAAWAMDLGTTTCAVAVYDREAGEPVLCTWNGRSFFASTLVVEEDGTERVGLSGEELLADRVRGAIRAAKRRIGRSTRFRIRDRDYRAEEVAARLIAHGRDLVESFLAERVAERAAELARADLGRTPPGLADRLARDPRARIPRDRAILTIPAFFGNNQKQATRDACAIARVDLVRLIHEPTAACIAATRQRRLAGNVVVVDLGAGTLDISALTVDDGVYEVLQVTGDNAFGGRDLDTVIGGAIERRLARDGVTVPAKGKDRLRFEIAVEELKITLSGQSHAVHPMPGFLGDPGFVLALGRDELADILDEPLARLRAVCAGMRDSLDRTPDHLVLVGGPMLAPPVAATVEGVFGLRRTVLADPRAAVVFGAALQAAVLSGALADQVLLDVTPLALGIRVDPDEGAPEFSEVIGANTTIPVQRTQVYTTAADGQEQVLIEIYNGDLDPASKIAEFQLGGIPPAPRGEPKIEVTFAIDASCVLEVTAKDVKTGSRRSISVADTTLLPPAAVREMAERQRGDRDEAARRAALATARGELSDLLEEAERADGAALLAELRRLRAAHRAGPSRPDPMTERALTQIHGREFTEVEAEVRALEAPLREASLAVSQYLAGEPDEGAARALTARLRELVEQARPRLAQLRLWTAVLVRLAADETDPLLRFRRLHAVGDHARALEAVAELAEPPRAGDDVERWLHCLAETGAAEAYRDVLRASGDALGVLLRDPAHPEGFDAQGCLVRVGRVSGFLLTPTLVVTEASVLVGEGDLSVVSATGTIGVVGSFTLPGPRAAVLRLAAPVRARPLRLAHPNLTRIGDPAFLPSAGTLRATTVDAFEAFPEQSLDLVRVRLPGTAAADNGLPLLNAQGEVLGLLTGAEHPRDTTYALSTSSLLPLLTSAGYGLPS
ncbi:hypothetical protein GCM10022221_23090 [Actinocorallia aurea]